MQAPLNALPCFSQQRLRGGCVGGACPAMATPTPTSLPGAIGPLATQVFRTNSSYARWLEARCLWGSLVNRCRNLGRQAVMLLPLSKANIKDAILKWSASEWLRSVGFRVYHSARAASAVANAFDLGSPSSRFHAKLCPAAMLCSQAGNITATT